MQGCDGPYGLARIPDNLLREPLEYLRADHDRHRRLCELLGDLAAAEDPAADTERGRAAAAFLKRDLPQHAAIETDCLFPRLLRYCPREDHAADLTERLRTHHSTEALLAAGLVDCLSGVRPSPRTSDRLRQMGPALTQSLRAHLDWENARVLRLAARRIPNAELSRFGREAAAVLGVDFPD